MASIKILLPYVDEAGKLESLPTTVQVGEPRLAGRNKTFDIRKIGDIKYEITYRIALPEHVVTGLKPESVFLKGELRKFEDITKTVSAHSLQRVVEIYNTYIEAYYTLKKQQAKPFDKVIMYKFIADIREKNRSRWNGMHVCSSSNVKMMWAVGYTMKQDGKTYYFNEEKRPYHSSYDSDFTEGLKTIPYSDEANQMFENINNLMAKIAEGFFRIDNYIEGGQLLTGRNMLEYISK